MAACSLTLSFDFETEDKILAFFTKLGEAFLLTKNLGLEPPTAKPSQPKLPVARGGNAGVSSEVIVAETPAVEKDHLDKILDENAAAAKLEQAAAAPVPASEPTTSVPVTKKPRAKKEKAAPVAGPDDAPLPLDEPQASPFDEPIEYEEFKTLGNTICRLFGANVVSDVLKKKGYRGYSQFTDEERRDVAGVWKRMVADHARRGTTAKAKPNASAELDDEIPF
jgi:hypothetical protein